MKPECTYLINNLTVHCQIIDHPNNSQISSFKREEEICAYKYESDNHCIHVKDVVFKLNMLAFQIYKRACQ